MSGGVKEIPMTIHGHTLHGFDEFRDYVLNTCSSKGRTVAQLTEEVQRFEKKFGVTSEEMARKFPRGDFENLDDEYEMAIWFAHYQSLKNLTHEGD